MAFGGGWITAVALKDIAAEAGGVRTVPALAIALLWLCSGAGGILMGRVADRFGTRSSGSAALRQNARPSRALKFPDPQSGHNEIDANSRQCERFAAFPPFPESVRCPI